MAIQLSEVTTAADVIAKFQWRRQNSQKEKDEIDHSRLSINRSSKKKDSNLELYLCEVGGNIGKSYVLFLSTVRRKTSWLLREVGVIGRL